METTRNNFVSEAPASPVMAVVTLRTLFAPQRVIGTILGGNLLIGLGLLFSWWLAQHGVPYLVTLFGVLALFLPGFNAALALEQLTERREKLSTILLWSTIFTLTITPAAAHLIGLTVSGPVPVLDPLTPFLMWWGLSLVALLTVNLIKKVVPGFTDPRLDRKNLREGAILFFIFLAIVVINFVLYPFLPEGDGYALLIHLKRGELNPILLVGEPRIIFFVLVNLSAQLLQLDPYWILKGVLPLFYIGVVATIYLVARPLIKQTSLRILAAMSPLLFPVILQEALISRPQTIVVLTLVPSLYLLGKIISERAGLSQLYWFIALMGVGIVGLKIHTLLFLLTILGLVASVITLWPTVKKRPLDALVLTVALGILLYPWVAPTRILADIWYLLKLFGQALQENEFNFWFIDHYRNADGQEVGWPGLTSLFYYGYNIGLLLPALLIAAAVAMKHKILSGLWRTPYWAILGVLTFFFVIAEVMPRFQLAYMPDRAWLFVVLAASLLIPRVLAALSRSKKWLSPFVVGSAVLSLLVGTAITYVKQGWIIREEHPAGEYIRHQTPQEAVFLGGGGIMVAVRYYGGRTLIRPDETVFMSDNEESVERYLSDQEALYARAFDDWRNNRVRISEQIRALGEDFRQYETLVQGREILDELGRAARSSSETLRDADVIAELFPTINAPIYLIYSRHKFDSLYGQRSWWRVSNFYGANVNKFSAKYPVVYNDQGVTIWEVRK